MEKDNEINVNGGSYDFGARIYDSRLGRWLSLDPLMEEYPYLSNYSHALNNPIFFRDPDGNVIIGTDGKPVTFEIVKSEDGKFSLIITSNNIKESSDAFRILNSLVLSEMGRSTLNTMNSSEIKYKAKRMYIKKGNNDSGHGETKSKGGRFKDNRPKSPKITVYMNYDKMYTDRFAAFEGLDESYYINVVMVHEVQGHCESSIGATIDKFDYKLTKYSLDLVKRRAHDENNGSKKQNELDIEDDEFDKGYLEYDKYKVEFENSKKLLTSLYESGVIKTKEDYDRRMSILNNKEIELEEIRERVLQRIKDYDENNTED